MTNADTGSMQGQLLMLGESTQDIACHIIVLFIASFTLLPSWMSGVSWQSKKQKG
jgi:hypothetical protein